jgi:hypothetical protein
MDFCICKIAQNFTTGMSFFRDFQTSDFYPDDQFLFFTNLVVIL